MRVGIDVGGTFTDITLQHDDGAFSIGKIPSTPNDQSIALAEGIRQVLAESGHAPADIDFVGHGTTVATNTLLELDGAHVALIVTKGFRDLLEIARQRRPKLYDLNAEKPVVLVPRHLTFEVNERCKADGTISQPLDTESLAQAIDGIAATSVDAVAICLLHSYKNDTNERLIEEALAQRLPGVYISRSSAVAPEFREYERFSTTVINAYVGPRMDRYVSNLERRVHDLGIAPAPKVIQSNGGIVSPTSIIRRPVSTLLSGPSAGVVGAIWIAKSSGYNNIITFDMGGTSTDVCLVKDGQAFITPERTIGGYVVRTPSVSIHTVGAGGGSIAKVDSAGALLVGPQSAGAVPGPAAYGRGGAASTVTDANIVLSHQNPHQTIGGDLHIDADAAATAIDAIATGLNTGREQAALGVLRVATATMARAVRRVSVDHGQDPREFALVAYGGAGPLHALDVAREVGVRTVLIPPSPGTLCALGLLVSTVRTEIVHSVLVGLDAAGLAELASVMQRLRQAAEQWFDEEEIEPERRELHFVLEIRYARQNFELPVSLDGIDRLDVDNIDEIRERFHAVHEQTYGFRHQEAAMRIVTAKLIASRTPDSPELPTLTPRATGSVSDAIAEIRDVTFANSGERPVTCETPVYQRDALCAGDTLAGPAVIEQQDSTAVIPPAASATVDGHGTIIVEVQHD